MTEMEPNITMPEDDWRDRTRRLLGDGAVECLSRAKVLVAGLGGVGGYVAETLVRSGIGSVTAIDADTVAESNINRQLIALVSTVGQPKAALWQKRLEDINPECDIDSRRIFITPDNAAELLAPGFDFVADCIDTVAPKVALVREALRRGIPVISSMGAGGRLDPSAVRLGDLWDTREDGLARAVRQAFKRCGEHPRLKVVWSAEAPRKSALIELPGLDNKRSSFGTLATIPAVFGLYMANHIILRIVHKGTKDPKDTTTIDKRNIDQ